MSSPHLLMNDLSLNPFPERRGGKYTLPLEGRESVGTTSVRWGQFMNCPYNFSSVIRYSSSDNFFYPTEDRRSGALRS